MNRNADAAALGEAALPRVKRSQTVVELGLGTGAVTPAQAEILGAPLDRWILAQSG